MSTREKAEEIVAKLMNRNVDAVWIITQALDDALESAEHERDTLKAERDAFQIENHRLLVQHQADEQRVRALEEQSNRPKCLFCTFGEDADFSIEDLKQHIDRECDYHPLRRMRQALRDIRGLLVVKPHRHADQTERIHAILDAALTPPPAEEGAEG